MGADHGLQLEPTLFRHILAQSEAASGGLQHREDLSRLQPEPKAVYDADHLGRGIVFQVLQVGRPVLPEGLVRHIATGEQEGEVHGCQVFRSGR